MKTYCHCLIQRVSKEEATSTLKRQALGFKGRKEDGDFLLKYPTGCFALGKAKHFAGIVTLFLADIWKYASMINM